MLMPKQFKCDVKGCDHVKGPSNGWWMIEERDGQLCIDRWNEENEDVEGISHICSQDCAVRFVSKWMARPYGHVTEEQ